VVSAHKFIKIFLLLDTYFAE